jgi:lysosomal Pro-X carboxypeptidase
MKTFAYSLALALLSARLAYSAPYSSADCSWHYFAQPLSHFARALGVTYQQRACIYDKFWKPDQGLPIFLYTGNESPVEEYVNNTGLIWDLAESMNALVVFAEHRYFGGSVPSIEGMDNCLAYLSSEEALADYASVVNRLRREYGGAQDSPVIAFGGSYGGMLASWLRIMYPSAVDGGMLLQCLLSGHMLLNSCAGYVFLCTVFTAIAASAPVWGFPLDGCPVDGSAKVVTYAASEAAGSAPNCADNLKSAYVLLSDIGSTQEGREALSQAMNLCTPLKSAADVVAFLNYLQTPLFDLSEGSYPFPTDYITYALTGSTNPLPSWAMQVMCNPLATDFGARISGNPDKVDVTVAVGKVEVHVDWDKTTNNGYSQADVTASGALDLVSAVAQSIQVWYNVSGELPSCVDWATLSSGAPLPRGANTPDLPRHSMSKQARRGLHATQSEKAQQQSKPKDVTQQQTVSAEGPTTASSATTCTLPMTSLDAGTAWNALTCNEGINLVNWRAQGVGGDLYWPPNQAKDYTPESIIPGSLAYCPYLQGMGLYGVPEKGDDWSFWLDTAYGGTRLQYASNIVFSNGNLDPWSPAGVAYTQLHKEWKAEGGELGKKGVTTRAINQDGSVVSVLIDMGGHHLDLFWPTEQDPESVRCVTVFTPAVLIHCRC